MARKKRIKAAGGNTPANAATKRARAIAKSMTKLKKARRAPLRTGALKVARQALHKIEAFKGHMVGGEYVQTHDITGRRLEKLEKEIEAQRQAIKANKDMKPSELRRRTERLKKLSDEVSREKREKVYKDIRKEKIEKAIEMAVKQAEEILSQVYAEKNGRLTELVKQSPDFHRAYNAYIGNIIDPQYQFDREAFDLRLTTAKKSIQDWGSEIGRGKLIDDLDLAVLSLESNLTQIESHMETLLWAAGSSEALTADITTRDIMEIFGSLTVLSGREDKQKRLAELLSNETGADKDELYNQIHLFFEKGIYYTADELRSKVHGIPETVRATEIITDEADNQIGI